MDLTDKNTLIPLLQKYHLYTNKQLGQHLLVNPEILQTIIETADIKPTDTILEIGPGTGVLTRELAARANKVITYEIDTNLTHLLAETLADYPNIDLHFQDFRSSSFQLPASNFKIVANLPYNAATRILSQIITNPNPPESITVLIQREVAQKIIAQPPHATYLSNFTKLYGTATLIKHVPPSAFFPPPAVHSAILHIVKHAERSPLTFGPHSREGENPNAVARRPSPVAFSRFLHRGFAQPRKMLNKAFPIHQLQSAHIDPTLRPENLALSDWLNLYKITSDDGKK